MTYDFDRIAEREGTNCEKYDHRAEVFGRGDVIPLWVADMDFEAPPFVVEAMRRRLEHPVFGYTFRGDTFHDAVTAWIARRNGWTVEREWIDFTPGVVAGFTFAIRALTDQGDGVVIQPPVYPPFAQVVKANGRKVVDNPLKLNGGRYEIDFDDLDRKLAGARVLLFCNPHNPTGRVFSREELIRVGELCERHGVAVISDEIHSDLIQKPYRHTHLASLSPWLAEHTVTFVAPSKTFNLAGLSTSVAITPGDALRRRLRAELDRLHVAQGNVFGTVALEAAYTYGDEWLDQLNAYIGGNKDYVADFLACNLPSVGTFPLEGTYLMWLDFRQWGMTQKELSDFLVNEAYLGLNDGAYFGSEGQGFMRLNLGTSRRVIAAAMKQLKEAYEKRNTR